MTAEEFCNTFTPTGKTWQENFHQTMIEFAKLKVTEALKAASERALIEYGMNDEEEPFLGNPVFADEYKYVNFDSLPTMEINKQSILSAYPLDLIK
jgi:hypothetical protein